jgi:maltooligosyltrehalose trehalohydrolase
VLITGEREGYYSDYAAEPARMLARCLSEGFAFQGEPSTYRDGARRGSDSRRLSPPHFVFCLQNHDQIGNRALGERLAAIADPDVLRVGVALLLLAPQIPLLFMGEEVGTKTPFLYFTSYEGELAEAVKSGRRKEFGKFPEFSTVEAQRQIPDPNRPDTFEHSKPDLAAHDRWAMEWRRFYRGLLELRHSMLIPRLDGAQALGASALSPTALDARWRLGDRATLVLAANFGAEPVDWSAPTAEPIFACGIAADTTPTGKLAGRSFRAFLLEPR